MDHFANLPPFSYSHYSLNDEMWQQDQIQPHWQPFIQAIGQMGVKELDRLQLEIGRLLRENGVTYNLPNQLEQRRSWQLDLIPLIIHQKEWQIIEQGMKQRAQLFNLLLQDSYGPRRAIAKGVIPFQLILGHNGFLRACDGIRLRGNRELILYAADLARGPDKQMWVLADRTQAPSGAGYALQNRTIMARCLGGLIQDCDVYRLSKFFAEWQNTLIYLSPQQHNPRVVILTPGPRHPTYFEHIYLASYLGYSLVQGDDLTMRNGVVWLKTLEGLQRVDVILRRIDDSRSDPLELREESWQGVAGLVEATRRQTVAIANPLGSSVLENPALMPFLPALARYFLGEELILPSAATWWCGQERERGYVLANLGQLVIKRLARNTPQQTVFGSTLSKAELEALREEIKTNPHQFVGQELVSFSTTPSWVEGKLAPRHTLLRSFVVAGREGYQVMPGGLARSAPLSDNLHISNRSGGISKDTWVLADGPQTHLSLWLRPERIEEVWKSSFYLPSRSAENLFWVGRYSERAEATTRLLRYITTFFSENVAWGDEAELVALSQLLRGLTEVTGCYPGFTQGDSAENPLPELLNLLNNSNRVGTLAQNLQGMMRSASAARDLWPSDTWRILDEIEQEWGARSSQAKSLADVPRQLNYLLTRLMALSGLNNENMTHETGWRLLDIGRRLERALLTSKLFIATLAQPVAVSSRPLLMEGVLRITENIITYRRRYQSHLQIETVLDLLLRDEQNPRAVAYQIQTLRTHISQLPRTPQPYRLDMVERLILDVQSRLQLCDSLELGRMDSATGGRPQLQTFLQEMIRLLTELGSHLTQTYFSHAQLRQQLLPSKTKDV